MTPVSAYTILVALETESLLEPSETWLGDRYAVRRVSTDDELDAELLEHDVVLVDRGVPTYADGRYAGTDARDADNLLAVLTDVDGTLLEIAHCDSLSTPFSPTELLDAVERLRRRGAYDDALAARADLAAERGALEATRSVAELEADPEYRDLCQRIEALDSRLTSLREAFDAADFTAAFRAWDFTGAARTQRVGWPS